MDKVLGLTFDPEAVSTVEASLMVLESRKSACWGLDIRPPGLVRKETESSRGSHRADMAVCVRRASLRGCNYTHGSVDHTLEGKDRLLLFGDQPLCLEFQRNFSLSSLRDILILWDHHTYSETLCEYRHRLAVENMTHNKHVYGTILAFNIITHTGKPCIIIAMVL